MLEKLDTELDRMRGVKKEQVKEDEEENTGWKRQVKRKENVDEEKK